VSRLRRTDPKDRLRQERDQLLPGCQTGGKVLADRALSRLLKKDWPRTLDALESSRAAREPPI